MKIAVFGSTYAGGYAFSQIQAEDTIPSERSAAIQQVGGQGGAFDVWGDDNGPIGPIVVTKKFTLKSSSLTAVDTDEATLRAATIAAGRTKLWLLGRDGTTHRWAHAKCIGLNRGEKPAEFLHRNYEAKFLLSEGLWYAESESNGVRLGAGNLTCTNNGNTRALVRAVVSSGATNPGLAIGSGPPIWAWTGVTAGTGLIVNAQSNVVTNDGADAYANLSYGPAGVGQVQFFWLNPGANTVIVTMTGSVFATLYWYDTYL